MAAANKVDLMKGFTKLSKYSTETLLEFIARFDNEIHNIWFQGMEWAEEIKISVLQQAVRKEHETYLRTLIEQKTTYEKLRENLLTCEATNKLDASQIKEVKYINTTSSKFGDNTFVKNSYKTSRKYNSKFSVTSST